MISKVFEDYKNLEFVNISNGTCNYLQDRQQHLYYFTKKNLTSKEYRNLLDQGFRRAGKYVYRPFCNFCSECQIIRVPVHYFKKSKSQKRVWNTLHKLGFDFKITKPFFSLEKLIIYLKYLKIVHNSTYKNLLMDNLTINTETYKTNQPILIDLIEGVSKYPEFFKSVYEDYNDFFLTTCLEKESTKELNLWINQKLIGIGILDIVEDAYSSVYFFYDPDFQKYSIGTFSILLEIEIAKLYNLNYYYLGYYINDCSKMNYKKNFRPNEIKRIYEKNYRNFLK